MIDRFPEGAAMDVKSLAAFNPLYGQQAVRTALNKLSAAGHLRRVRERVGADRSQWVFRTYFSRTPRGDGWWNHFIATGEAPPETLPDTLPPAEQPGTARPREASTDAQPPPAEETPAHRALAGLGAADRRLALSAADCAALEPLAAEWLARGATEAVFRTAMTAGLPPEVHSPAAFTRRRLVDKLPPVRPAVPPHPGHPADVLPVTRLAECTDCRVPARPNALLGGLCRACRTGGRSVVPPPSARLAPTAVHRHAARVRAALHAGAIGVDHE
ncbi:MarR family transcriptional regulator [Kitasatospora purpeofusca]|uniref:MarR family transcriptional regulator n=1 Tax=Kitasatospora purpeofusca TaxID=67352 RepID=UPI003684F319